VQLLQCGRRLSQRLRRVRQVKQPVRDRGANLRWRGFASAMLGQSLKRIHAWGQPRRPVESRAREWFVTVEAQQQEQITVREEEVLCGAHVDEAKVRPSVGAAIGPEPCTPLHRSTSRRLSNQSIPSQPPSPPHSLSPLHVFVHPGHGMPVWETMPTLISQSSPAPRRPAVMVVASALRDSTV
jgi:hypothetical protein